VYFDLGQGDDYIYHGKTHFTGLHKKDELRLSETQRRVFGKEVAGDIYPEYYILKVNNFDDRMKDRLDEWIYFLKHNAVKDEFKAKGLDKARKILDRDNLTPEERKTYEYVQDLRSENLSFIASSKDEGITEGMKKGRKEREKLAKELEKERKECKEREKREKELEKELEQERQEHEKERQEREEREKKLEREREKLLAEIARLKQK
jgi:hypothetical protein